MNTTLKWFKGATANTIKSAYKKLVAEYHPDTHQTEFDKYNNIMCEINAEYDLIMQGKIKLSAVTGNEPEQNQTAVINPEMQEVIDRLMNIDGNIQIDIVSKWVWVSGDTYSVKDQIKAIDGMRYAKNKKMWYWRASEDATSNRRKMSYEEVKERHGVQGSYKAHGTTKIASEA